MMRIFCVANQKGGVGKTTTTVNLAAGLAQLGRRVLVVDLDPQGNATMGSGIDKRALDLSVYDVLLENASVAEARQTQPARAATTSSAPTASWPAPRSSWSGSSGATSACASALGAVRRRLRLRAHRLPAEPEPADAERPVRARTASIVPMQCEYFALEGLSDLVNTIKQVHANLNPALEVIGILRVMFDAAHHAAAAGQRAAQGALRRQGVRHRDPAQRPPRRGAELRHARRRLRSRRRRARSPSSSSRARWWRASTRCAPSRSRDATAARSAFDEALLARIEDAGINASAPREQRWVDGWLRPPLARQGQARALHPGGRARASAASTTSSRCACRSSPRPGCSRTCASRRSRSRPGSTRTSPRAAWRASTTPA